MSQAPRPGWASMREALHAEWTKLRTAPGTIWPPSSRSPWR
jgi:hypothetical protein